MPKKTGKVYLIGAGPGNPELITVKAKNLLEDCDAVVYDHLVSLELIVGLPSRVERHYAGKSAGRHSLEQDEINRLLLDLALQGKTVARLKGGDPFIFGRGGEEAIHLKQNGIPFEIVPGITAGAAAPASAGIPLTHRGKSAYTVFLTAHEAPDKEESQVPWDLFSKLENGTLVGYMGVSRLKAVAENLISGGMSGETPAGVVERGTRGTQKVVTGELANIAELAGEAGIRPPAVFVIGEVVNLRESIITEDDKPLSGRTIMITRPGDQAGEMYRKLRLLGAEALPLPTIATEEFYSPDDWENFHNLEGGWLIFTSENGIRYFFRHFFREGCDMRSIAGFKIAVIGVGTEKALTEYGLKSDFVPSKFTLKTLAEELDEGFEWNDAAAVRVRGSLSDITLEEKLTEAGARVYPLTVYETSTAKWDAGMKAAFTEAQVDAVTFTSGSTVTGLLKILGEDGFKNFLAETAVVSIGSMTSRVIRETGIEPSVEAETHSVEGVINATLNHFQNIRKR